MDRDPAAGDATIEILDKIGAYRARANQFLENAAKFSEKKELEKASEFAWGAIASLINGIVLLYTGQAKFDHRSLVNEGEEIAKALEDQRLGRAISTVGERLHANYYHGFINEVAFREDFAEIVYAASRLEQVLEGEVLSRLFQHSASG